MRRSTAFLHAACAGRRFGRARRRLRRNGPDHRQYQLHGQVLNFSADRKEATIEHDAITGFMPAVTMPYKVRDPALFDGVTPGDIIDAILFVIPNDAYSRWCTSPAGRPFRKAPHPPAWPRPRGGGVIADGYPVPNATFLNQDGETVDLRAFGRDALVVTFTYTRCPMPTMCPLMDRNFQALQAKLKARPELRAHLLSVTIDPTFDRPAVLEARAHELGADPTLWTFLTSADGEPGDVDAFASQFGLAIARNPDNPVDITHTLRTLLIDRDGNLVKGYTGNEWTPEQVIGDLVVLVGVD